MAAWTASTVSTSGGAPSSKRTEAGGDVPARLVAILVVSVSVAVREGGKEPTSAS